MAIQNPMSLNQGRGDQTYGEINPIQLEKIYELVKITENDIVLDMGSGIGNLVLCTSIMTKAKKVYGIEFSEDLNKYAKKNKMWFERVVSHVGRKSRPCELLCGDFLDVKYENILTKEANVIIINNYAFSETLQNGIVEVLSKCKNGTRIVTTKEFRRFDRRGKVIKPEPSDKPMAIDTFYEISKVEELVSVEKGFSWCGKKVPLFLTTIRK